MSELVYGKEYNRGNINLQKATVNTKNIFIAKVISVDDENNVGRIKVFIDGIDQTNLPLESYPYAYPAMSRIIHVMPKVGEAVLVFMADKSKESQLYGNRFWIGPIITNYKNIKDDNQDTFGTLGSSSSFLLTQNINFDPIEVKSQNNKNDEINIFPVDNTTPPIKNDNNLENVSLLGRDNTDIIQSENKINLRAGKHKKGLPKEINTKNPTYSVLELIDENTSYSLTAGDEIYLVSHKGRYKFKKVLTKDDIQELRDNAQSMLYGELTVKYLKVLTEVFLNHIHQHPGMPPTYGATSPFKIEDLRRELQNIEQLLAKNIKIN
jgi:hypothetical protein